MKKLFSNLRGIGIFFTAKPTDFKKEAITPEEALINALPELRSDRLTLQLIHTWLRDNADLLHAEALQRKIESIESATDLAFLASLLELSDDKRLIAVALKIKYSKNGINDQLDKTLWLAAKFGQCRFDPVFEKHGLKVSELQFEDEKKFIPRKYFVQDNPFFLCRTLFGSNWRADVAAILLIRDMNPTEISKELGCSYETAHRNYQSLKAAGWPRIEIKQLNKHVSNEI